MSFKDSELKKWQKLVMDDDNKEVIVLKGRRVGASSLAFILSKNCDSLYVTSNHEMMQENMNRFLEYIEGKSSLSIYQCKKHSPLGKRYVKFIKDDGSFNTMYFTTIDEIINTQEIVNVDKVMFDEIYKYEIDLYKINKIKEKVEQIYYFTSPASMKESLYIVPSPSNVPEEEYISEIREVISPEIFREEILAGVVFSETLDKSETNVFVPEDEVEEIESDEVEEFIEYKGKKYKLVE